MRTLLPLTLLLATCRGAPEPVGPPDLVLILAPGLRDGAAPLSEEADAFRAGLALEGARSYRAAYAQSADPRTSLGALLTGRYPSGIPLCGDPRSQEFSWAPPSRDAAPWCSALPPNTRTLPEVLGIYGYQAALARGEAVGADLLDGAFPKVMSGPRWRSQAAAWWASTEGPRFLTIVLPDLQLPALAERLPEAARDSWRGRDGRRLLSPERLRTEHAAAAGEAGRAARSALDALAEAGGGRPLVVAATSTHGLSLSERNEARSTDRAQGMDYLEQPTARLLLERTLHVPLEIAGPGIEAGAVDAPAELVDLLPTLIALGGAAPISDLPGQDLLAAAPDPGGWAYAELGDMLALRQGAHLLTFRAWIHHGTSLDPELTRRLGNHVGGGDFAPFTLHDVVADPLQREDLSGRDVARVEAMAEQLQATREGHGAAPEAFSPDQLKVLQRPAMGYW